MAGNVSNCKFNVGVGCAGGACERCGWNPSVEARRKMRIREELTMGETCAECVYYRVSLIKKASKS